MQCWWWWFGALCVWDPCLGPWTPEPLPCSVGGGGLEPCVSRSPAWGLDPWTSSMQCWWWWFGALCVWVPCPGPWTPGPLPCSVGGGGLEPCVSGTPSWGLGPLDLFHAVLVVVVWSPVCLGPLPGAWTPEPLPCSVGGGGLEPCVSGSPARGLDPWTSSMQCWWWWFGALCVWVPCLGPWTPGPLPCSVGGGGLEPCVSGTPAWGLDPWTSSMQCWWWWFGALCVWDSCLGPGPWTSSMQCWWCWFGALCVWVPVWASSLILSWWWWIWSPVCLGLDPGAFELIVG